MEERKMNGIYSIVPIESEKPSSKDFIFAMMSDLGCSVGNMPKDYPLELDCGGPSELFDPEKVSDPDDLPALWRMVYDKHNEPIMKDCRTLRYRYVYLTDKILCDYPRLPCNGIFVLCSRSVRRDRIKARDLTNINNEFLGD